MLAGVLRVEPVASNWRDNEVEVGPLLRHRNIVLRIRQTLAAAIVLAKVEVFLHSGLRAGRPAEASHDRRGLHRVSKTRHRASPFRAASLFLAPGAAGERG